MSTTFERPTCMGCFEPVVDADPGAGRLGEFTAYDRRYWRHVAGCDGVPPWLRVIAHGMLAAPDELLGELDSAEFDGEGLELGVRYAILGLNVAIDYAPRSDLPDGVSDLVARRRSVGAK